MNSTEWSEDIFAGFETKTVTLAPDDDGELVFTVVRRVATTGSTGCVIYVHGFSDYFFQQHLADAYLAGGIDFYAVDLRRCGRSYRSGNRRNYIDGVADYSVEIAESVRIAVQDDHHDHVILHGHSMGGLASCIFAAKHPAASQVDLLALNSPFLDVKLSPSRRIMWWITKHFGHRFAHKELKGDLSTYVESIHSDYRGEWAFDLSWKPKDGEVVYPGWARAIALAQSDVHAGMGIGVPVLVQHSDRSTSNDEWDDDLMISDGVLDVDQIHRWAPSLGPDVTVETITHGMHDLVLSSEPVRTQMLAQLFDWIDVHS